MSSRRDLVIPKLQDFHVSEMYGFLLDLAGKTSLPDYFRVWHELGENLAALVSSHTLRQQVQQMPLLDHTRLQGYRQKRVGFTLLCIIGSGYVWQYGREQVQVVPRQLAVPWCALSDELGLQPCISHAAFVLSNWIHADPLRPLDADNVKFVYLLPGGRHCEWFLGVTVEMEMAAVPGIKCILSAMDGIVEEDAAKVTASIEGMTSSAHQMKAAIARMYENLDPDVFYNVLRIYLMGWAEGSLIPEGLVYEGVMEQPRKLIGGSAAQSSTVQCFDIALGILHPPKTQSFLDTMRSYMPPSHAAFLQALKTAPSIRHYVEERSSPELKELYNQCIAAVTTLRTFHLQMVARYIVGPASLKKRTSSQQGAAEAGTGGTNPIPFLKAVRDSTATHQL